MGHPPTVTARTETLPTTMAFVAPRALPTPPVLALRGVERACPATPVESIHEAALTDELSQNGGGWHVGGIDGDEAIDESTKTKRRRESG